MVSLLDDQHNKLWKDCKELEEVNGIHSNHSTSSAADRRKTALIKKPADYELLSVLMNSECTVLKTLQLVMVNHCVNLDLSEYHAETDTMQQCKLYVLEVGVVAQPLSIVNAHGTAVLL